MSVSHREEMEERKEEESAAKPELASWEGDGGVCVGGWRSGAPSMPLYPKASL